MTISIQQRRNQENFIQGFIRNIIQTSPRQNITSTSLQSPQQPEQSHQQAEQRALNPPPSRTSSFASRSYNGTTRPLSLAVAFEYHRWEKVSREKRPQLYDRVPLPLFFHAEEHMNRCVQKLRKVKNTQSVKFHRILEKVHRLQKLLLDTIYLIYAPMPEEIKSSRDYRLMLPIEDQSELDGGFSENILFAAQAISAGFRVRGIERHSEALREPARQLCASFSAVIHVFRRRALENPRPPYVPDLIPVLRDFDWTWTRFEQRICFCYFSLVENGQMLNSNTDLAGNDFFAILLSETVMRGLELGYFFNEDLQNCEPFLMFAIPRLALINGLLTFNGYTQTIVSNSSDNEWFGTNTCELYAIQQQLMAMDCQNVERLERLLVDSNQEKNLGEDYEVKQLFCRISEICDGLQSGPRAKELAKILRRVFKMYFDEAIDEVPKKTCTKRLLHRGSRFVTERFSAWRSDEPFPTSLTPTLLSRSSFEIE